MTVSVIITTKDRDIYLLRSIYSVINQSVKPKEIIIIDDASLSKLDISSLLLKCKEKNIKLIYHYNVKNMGGNYCRNLGVRISKEDIIMFLDDDDMWLENKIRDQLALIRKGHKFIYSGKQFVKSTNLNKIIRLSKENNNPKNIWCGNFPGTTSGIALDKNIFIKAGGFDEQLKSLQDYDLWIRILRQTNAYWDQKYNVVYTIHAVRNKQISSNTENHIESIRYIYSKYSEELKSLDKKTYNIFKSRMLHVIARSFRKNGQIEFFKYWLKSIYIKPSIRTFMLLFFYK
ncbi:glycosyltransferase family 2 protein [Xenorhabdus sp. M]|uniref:Glycosyltransferase family 2 protein n=1 Tax=Xenorhabdus szentirmaii TaxID=290112 RepID=A0AAW3YU13_9GAMM|nr:glycosyltransferase family A protein [Xenorhabdus sp. M]MBD2800384.1 glycosyltransferase family 2 protein [Xenorhabdus sp. M]